MSEKVSVTSVFDSKKAEMRPVHVIWHGNVYEIKQVGLHHTIRVGNVLHHVFGVVAGELFMRLNLNTKTLHWTLEEAEGSDQ